MSVTITSVATAVKGTVGQGAILAIGSATSATPSATYQAIGGIQDVTGSGVKLGTVNSSDLTNRNVRRKGTTIDYGTITATIKNATADAGQAAAEAAQLSGEPYDFAIQYTDEDAGKAVTVTFSALVTEFGALDLAEDKLNTSKIELTLDGPWSIAVAA